MGDPEGVNEYWEPDKSSIYVELTNASEHFSKWINSAMQSIAFPIVPDENHEITEKISTLCDKREELRLWWSLMLDWFLSKLDLLSDFLPWEWIDHYFTSKHMAYSSIWVELYKNWIHHNQHSIVFDMDEIEVLSKYLDSSISVSDIWQDNELIEIFRQISESRKIEHWIFKGDEVSISHIWEKTFLSMYTPEAARSKDIEISMSTMKEIAKNI